jgi:hypothetical protein
MSAAKWIRFAVLLCFTFLFFFLANVRGESIWLMPAVLFGAFAAMTLRVRK